MNHSTSKYIWFLILWKLIGSIQLTWNFVFFDNENEFLILIIKNLIDVFVLFLFDVQRLWLEIFQKKKNQLNEYNWNVILRIYWILYRIVNTYRLQIQQWTKQWTLFPCRWQFNILLILKVANFHQFIINVV